ncbi:MAG: DUF4254 domain-containing protein [Desulfovibrionaceae bacterium]|nr:DUF4254 domain-containing protein [Desulfovibrionaceae bacterium]
MTEPCRKMHAYLISCFEAQTSAVAGWHAAAPLAAPFPVVDIAAAEALPQLVLNQHYMNYDLWHVEDTARRRDVSAEIIAGCKYRIDKLNQQRNDCMEQVDGCLLSLLSPHLPQLPADRGCSRHNTESLGMAVDRLSILALKIYHMEEQTRRNDADAAHRESCRKKTTILREQRSDLVQAVLDLVEDYLSGRKQPKLYFQFKMYNDPALNPELYAGK